jgi:lipid-binding SYLF domain-containing protein
LLTYSRSKGLFAGIDLNGASVTQSTDDTETYYGQAHGFRSILHGDVSVPEGAVPFVKTVAKAFVDAKTNY